MARSPINPSDIGYCRGAHPFLAHAHTRARAHALTPPPPRARAGNYSPGQKGLPPLPRQAGFEGSGTVVATGGGLLPWLVQGARVAVANSGESARASRRFTRR
jgi:NADPH:quinone reductase-like Zn-dependent oxidoreductase